MEEGKTKVEGGRDGGRTDNEEGGNTKKEDGEEGKTKKRGSERWRRERQRKDGGIDYKKRVKRQVKGKDK